MTLTDCGVTVNEQFLDGTSARYSLLSATLIRRLGLAYCISDTARIVCGI